MKKRFMAIIFLGLFMIVGIASARDFEVKWDPSPAEDNVKHYVLHWGTASGSYTEVSPPITGTTYLITLPDTPVYYLMVTAVSESGLESDPSNEINTKVPTAPNISMSCVSCGN